MPIRYIVRTTDQGFGVWDAAVNGWRSPDLDRPSADALAAKLNAGAEGPTGTSAPADPPADDVREVVPPKPVEVFLDGAWWPATLDRWARRPDGWYGHAVRRADGVSGWYLAGQLRLAR